MYMYIHILAIIYLLPKKKNPQTSQVLTILTTLLQYPISARKCRFHTTQEQSDDLLIASLYMYLSF